MATCSPHPATVRAMLIDDIKARFKQAMKARLEVEREILRVAIGDITTRDATSDEDVQAVLRKLLKSNEETLGHGVSDDERAKLEQENQVLREFLPRTLDEVQIVEALRAADFLSGEVEAIPAEGVLSPDSYEVVRGAGRTAPSARHPSPAQVSAIPRRAPSCRR